MLTDARTAPAAQSPLRRHMRDLVRILRNPGEPVDGFLMTSHGDVDTVGKHAVSRYTSDERLRREQDTLFRNYPLVLEHEGRIPPGHSLAMDIAGRPLLLTNDKGAIRVFLNQCRHRSTRLQEAGTLCERSHIVCPYHNWSYRLDGSLKAVPHGEGFPGLDKTAHGLIELPSAVRHGLIMAAPDPQAAFDADNWLGPLGAYLEELDTGRFHFYRHSSREWACNWKLPIDAFLEAYHIHRLHRETLAPLFKDNLALLQTHGHHMAAAVARVGVEAALDQAEPEWDPRNLVTFSLYLLPHTVIIYHPDYTSLVRFLPLATNRCRIEHSMLIPEPPASDSAERHWQRAWDLTDRLSFGEEDFHICEEMQAGMAAGGMQHLLLGTFEQALARYHGMLDEMM